MSTATMNVVEVPSQVARPQRRDVSFPRVVKSEWIKFATLRSSWLTLFGAVAAMVVIALVIAGSIGSKWSTLAPADAAPSGVLQGYFLAQLLIGVLGVLFVSAEYGTGMIRSTLAAVPRRIPVVLAKALVFGGIALAAMVTASVTGFLGAEGLLSQYHHGVSLGDPGVLRVVVGTGAFLAMVGLLGAVLGWIVRSTAGGIAGLVGILIVVPVILGVMPGTWGKTVAEYLPAGAGSAFTNSVHTTYMLSPWAGFAVLLAWVLGGLLAAAALVKRRDA
ncbi:MAG: type transport system permease protein [Frankiales bacterium]|nr:type transport system permease protein [Frankiales bacterium]